MIRKLIFCSSYFFTLFLTIGASYNLPKFEGIQKENIASLTFELMLPVSMVLIGLFGLFSTRITPVFRRAFSGLTEIALGVYGTAASGLLGWISGLTVYSLLRFSWVNFTIGLMLTAYLSFLSIQVFKWHAFVAELSAEKLDWHIREFKHAKAFFILSLAFISIGSYGIYAFFYG